MKGINSIWFELQGIVDGIYLTAIHSWDKRADERMLKEKQKRDLTYIIDSV